MKIGVVSDSHNRVENLKEALEVLQNRGAEFFLHAGDIGEDAARYLLKSGIPFIGVYGNTDRFFIPDAPIFKEPHYFKIENRTFKLMHHPYFLTPDTDVVVYGHLHKFECEKKKSLYLNPGEICAREKPLIECALLNSETLEVDYLYKKDAWNIKRVCP